MFKLDETQTGGDLEYHTDYEGKLVVDENGEPIPIHICLCAAHGPSECVCGAWDDVPWDDWHDY